MAVMVKHFARIWGFALIAVIGVSVMGGAQEEAKPLVKGGIGDKPFIYRAGRGTSIGGYTEAHFRYERGEGVTEELTFEAKRFNLFTYTPVSDRVRVASELEFEEGGEEIKIEIAIMDFEVHPAFTFRGGVILSPLGRFNLAHDGPFQDLTDRPLVSTQIIPTTLSEAGMGFYGAFYPTSRSRVTYEFYGVNGFNDDVLIGDSDGTRIAAGKGNFEDNNNRPAWVGRLTLSPQPAYELGFSFHTGAYNTWKAEELTIDEKRNLTIVALDWDANWRNFELQGEYANASIDVPEESGIYQQSQQGYYAQVNAHFGQDMVSVFPGSVFTGIVRYGMVDFDTDTNGDDHSRLTLGINFRPQEDSVLKLDYQRNWTKDPFENEAKGAAVLFSMATYF
jgi:hypothetical protein